MSESEPTEFRLHLSKNVFFLFCIILVHWMLIMHSGLAAQNFFLVAQVHVYLSVKSKLKVSGCFVVTSSMNWLSLSGLETEMHVL